MPTTRSSAASRSNQSRTGPTTRSVACRRKRTTGDDSTLLNEEQAAVVSPPARRIRTTHDWEVTEIQHVQPAKVVAATINRTPPSLKKLRPKDDCGIIEYWDKPEAVLSAKNFVDLTTEDVGELDIDASCSTVAKVGYVRTEGVTRQYLLAAFKLLLFCILVAGVVIPPVARAVGLRYIHTV
jgi:hypothetical protein